MSNILIDRAEEALAAIVSAAVGNLASVITGKSSDDKSIPLVICLAEGGNLEEEPKATGNYFVSCTVMVKTRAKQNETATGPDATPKVTSQALVSIVANALQVDNLADLLSIAVADFTVFPAGVFYSTPNSGKDENGIWVDEFPLRLYCCASTLA